MNTENVSGDRKRDGKRKLLPLIALIVGLCVPVYAYAASEAECNHCHNTCQTIRSNGEAYCYARYYGLEPYSDLYDCLQQVYSDFAACNNYCATSPACI